MAEQEHDLDRIGLSNREKGAVGQGEAVGHQAMKVRVKSSRMVTIGLDRGDHRWKRGRVSRGTSCLRRGVEEDLPDRLVEAAAQLPQELVIVLETEAEHLGDGDDILADGNWAQDPLLDVLGKQQGALLVA